MAQLNSWQAWPIVIIFTTGAFAGLALSKQPLRVTVKPPHMGEVIVEIKPAVCPGLVSLPEDVASHGHDRSDFNA
jgi:hypothetical protein